MTKQQADIVIVVLHWIAAGVLSIAARTVDDSGTVVAEILGIGYTLMSSANMLLSIYRIWKMVRDRGAATVTSES